MPRRRSISLASGPEKPTSSHGSACCPETPRRTNGSPMPAARKRARMSSASRSAAFKRSTHSSLSSSSFRCGPHRTRPSSPVPAGGTRQPRFHFADLPLGTTSTLQYSVVGSANSSRGCSLGNVVLSCGLTAAPTLPGRHGGPTQPSTGRPGAPGPEFGRYAPSQGHTPLRPYRL